uniref:zinc finger protein 638-like n=1 Tax=Semicossyphus pulcher TaxID=241346 RepID=UPI0037E94C72
MLQDKTTSSVLQPTRVIDYGHISKYTAGVGDEIGRTSNRDNSGGSGNLLVTDTAANRHSREPLQNNSTELKSSALGSSLDQASSFTSLSSSYSSVLSSAASSSSEQTKRWQTQPNQTFQNILSSFPLQKKDTDINVLKCEATKPVPLNQLGDRQSTFKTQTPSTLSHSVHPSRPALVLIGSNDASGTKDQSKTEGQRSVAVEHIQKTQGQQKEQMQQQSMLQRHVQQTQPTQQLEQQQIKQPQKYPVLQTGQAVCLPVFGNPVPPTGFIPSLITVPTSKAQPSSKEAVSKILPAPEMMHDYDAASPRIFPHTGSLVNKECTDMKDWLSHQNSSLHLKSRTLLGQQAVGKDAKPSTSTSAQKIRHGSSSRSKSPSPYRQHGPEGERDKRRSRSRSPQSSRYNHRSRSRSCSPRYDCPTSSSYRSHSRSPKRWSSPRRKDERQSSPRKGRNRRSPLTRSNVSWSPPRRVDNKRSPPRRVNERRSPLRRGDERRPPPRRVDNRSSPPRRVNKRLSPPRTRENKRTPKKRDKSRSPPRRSHERQSSREGSSPQLNMSNSAASLAKKLLETTAVQSLSNQSDLETVVKTLAPALLAELAKMSSSLPPSSSRGKKLSSTTSSSSSTAGMKGCTIIPFKSKLGLQKSERGKVSPPTMVKLQGISKDLSHDDVFAAMEHFGKTKSVIVFRAQMEANICFENEEDAKKVKSLKSLDIKGTTITVVKKKDVTQKEMKLPLKKPATSSVSQHHTANSKMASTMTREGKVLLPTPTVPPLTGTLPCGARKSTAGKLINQSSAKVSVKGVRSVNKAKVLVSKAKYVSTKQIAKTMKTTKLPAKGEVKKAATNQKTSPENQPEAGDSRQKPIPEKSETSGPVVELKEAAEADKSENRTDREPEKGLLIQEKVLASKAEMVSSIKTPKTQVDNLAESGAVTTENVEETSAKFASVPSRSAASGNQPDVEMSTHEESETKVQESLVLPEDTAAVVEKANVTAFEPKDRADDAEPMELGATGVKVAELMEVGSYVEGKEKELRSTDQSRESRPSSSSVDTQSTETSAKALAKVKQSALSEPESTAQGPETQMEASEVQQAAGSTTDAAVEPLMPDPSTAEMTQIDSAKDASKAVCKASAASTEVPSSVNTKPTAEASKRPSSAVRPTIGEMLETNLSPINIYCWPSNHLSKGLPPGYRHLLISGLPFYFDGNYTEDDVANLLIPFGLRNKEDQLFVIPQSRMAFAMMSNGELVLYLLRAAAQHGIYLKGDRLFIEVLHIRFPLTPLQFYKFLKRALRCTEFDEGERTILIKNISQSEAWKLREALQDFGSVKNFMPLLNKLFVEFESIEDTDRFGDWYSLLCQAPAHKVIRLKKPNINCQSLRKSQRPVTAVPTDEASAKDASKAAENISAVVEEKVLTSQEKMNTTMQKPEKLPAAEAVTKESVAKDATVPSKIEASENQPGVSESKLKPGPEKSETSLQGPGVGLKETAQIDTSENRTISELAKGPSVEATILASKEEMVSTIQKAKTSEKLSATEAVSNQVIAKDATVLSQTEASENQLDVNDSKLKPIPDKSETSVKEPVEALKQTAEVDRTITKLAKGPLVEAKVLASKEQTVSMMQKPKAPSENLAATEAVSYKVIAKDVTVLSKTEACENLLEVSDSKLKPVPEKSETSLQGPGVGLKVNKSENRTISELAKGPSVEATILASNEEMVSTIQKAKTTSENVAATKAVSNQAIAKDATVLSQTEASENQLDVNDSKLKPIPDKSQTSVKEPVEGLKRTAQADKSEDRTITKLAKGPLVEAKVLASKEQTVSTMQKPKTLSDNLSATEAVSNKVIAKDVSVPLKTEACENPPEVSDSKLKAVPEISEISLQGPGVGLKETAEVDKSAKTANTAPRQDPKVLASKAERVSAMQEPQIPAEKLAAKEAVPNEMIAEDMIMPSKFEASENQPDTGDSKEKPVPDKSENRIKGPGVGSLESLEKPKTQVDKLAESGAVIKNNIEGTAPKDEGVPSRFSDSENQPQGENSKLKQSETKDQGSLEVPKDTAEAVEKANVTVFEPKDQAKLDRADEAEPMELGVTGIKGVELMEVESCTEDKGKEKTNTEGIPENSADKPRESQPPMTSVETQVTETSVKAFVQQSALSEPDSTAQGPETQIEASEVQQQAAGSTTEAAVEPLMPGGGAATKTTHKDPSTAEMTQIDSTSAKDASKAVSKASAVSTEVPSSVNTKPTAAAGSERQPAASKHSSSADYCPTVGEMLEKHLFPDRICCHPPNDLTCLDHRNRQLLISGLPIYNNGNYTDDDVANLLVPFGFENKEDQLYVIPQLRMAFAMMPSVDKMLEVMRESVQNGIYFREKRLVIQVVRIRDSLRPVLFYRFLKRQMKCYMKDEVERTVFIKNISQSEARELREALKEFGSVTNFMPLLNKLFVEFESVEDADRFGGWYSHLKQAPGHEVVRLKISAPPPTAAVSKHQPVASKPPSTADPHLTYGEKMERYLDTKRIGSFKCRPGTSPKLLISWLPVFGDGCYTEDDIIKLLIPFGYQHKDQNIYVVPQARVAFVQMPTEESVLDIIRASKINPIILKGSGLCFSALDYNISLRPFWFYESLMRQVGYHWKYRDSVIFIRNISPSETRELRQVVKKVHSVRNFLPLLNKVFVEFHTNRDADRLGVWYSLLKQPPGHIIQRLEIPYSTLPPSPRIPENALPDSKDVIEGATMPSERVAVPHGSTSPFWISLRKNPFVFPTISPWFIIPGKREIFCLYHPDKFQTAKLTL